MNYSGLYIKEVKKLCDEINFEDIEGIVELLFQLRERGGRCFFVGVGGSAANCSHAVNDFRKILGIESYSVSENISELTARINDDGWNMSYVDCLISGNFKKKDMLFVLSVGGGDLKNNVSTNIVNAVSYAKNIGAEIVGVLGRDGGHTAKNSNKFVIIPTVDKNRITPHSEEFQSVVLHLISSHPKLQKNMAKWESVDA